MTAASNDLDLDSLRALLDELPAPPSLAGLDGLLCGVLLQPGARIAEQRWMRLARDVEGRAPPASAADVVAAFEALVRQRHAELDAAIQARRWFDPWIEFEGAAEAAEPRAVCLPWAAGFASALEAFPALDALDSPALLPAYALIYQHFEPGSLDGEPALEAAIEAIEPPPDLAEAVQDLVQAVMLIADVSRPVPVPPRRNPPPGPGSLGSPRRRGQHPRSSQRSLR
jgi:uncharacterized protein